MTSPHGPRSERPAPAHRSHLHLRPALVLGIALATAVPLAATTATAAWPPAGSATLPDLGPTVIVFDPSMPVERDPGDRRRGSTRQQIDNEMGTDRYTLLFEPGVYGSEHRAAAAEGRLLHGGRRPRQPAHVTLSSTARSRSTTGAWEGTAARATASRW